MIAKNKIIALFLLFSCFVLVTESFAEKRVALVIGNGDYSFSPLKNPVNDANGMYRVLSKMNFEVIKGINLTRKQMRSKIREFGKAIRTADVGFFYFAGHGMQYNGLNYLVPVRADIDSEDEIMDESIDASSILRKMESAGTSVNIVVLDACRNNVFKRSFRSTSRGLTRIEGPKGSLIAYATAPGSVAADGEGRHGLYTENLIKYIQEPIPLEKVFKKVRISVSTKTNDKQIPWENSSLVGDDFYFNTGGGDVIIHNSVAVASEDIEAWQYIKDSKKALDFKLFLSSYPNSSKSTLAKMLLAKYSRQKNNDPLSEWAPKTSFDGRVGKVLFKNKALYAVAVRLWHPDSKKIFKTYRVEGQAEVMLNYNNLPINVGSDWGIQIGSKNSKVKTLSDISTWNTDHKQWDVSSKK